MRENAQTDFSSAILAEIPHLRAYARLMTNDRSEADREVEETLKAIPANAIRCCGKAQLRAMLFKIMHGLLVRDLGPALRRGVPEPSGALCSLEAAIRTANGDAQTMAGVGAALLRLDFDHREAIILSAAAKFSHLEIAGISGCEPERVRDSLIRGRAELAQLLRVSFVDDPSPKPAPAAPLEARDAKIMKSGLPLQASA
jgi:RNA polymerase sigma-70 factor (ECF subfamily)